MGGRSCGKLNSSLTTMSFDSYIISFDGVLRVDGIEGEMELEAKVKSEKSLLAQ